MSAHTEWERLRDRRLAEPGAEAAYGTARRDFQLGRPDRPDPGPQADRQ